MENELEAGFQENPWNTHVPLAVGRGGPSSPASALAIHQVQWGNVSFKALQEQVVTVSPAPSDCHPVPTEMQQD